MFLLWLRLSKSFGSGSRAGSDISFITTFYHRFHNKKWIFHVFLNKEYQPNSHAGFYKIWIYEFYFYLLLKLTRSQGRNFNIPAPAPAKSSSSLRLRLQLHNTGLEWTWDAWYFKFFKVSLQFLLGLGSKIVQIFHFVLNLICGCSKWVRICSIYVLNVAGAAQFRSWTEVEETIILNLCLTFL
jgi:hypothetical protein